MCLQCSFLHSLVESLCSFFYSSTVHSYCQLADSCFIILFQNLNPKKWKRERGGGTQLIITPEHPLCTSYLQLQNLGRFTQNSSMIKRHENDMLFTLLCYGVLEGWGGQIFGASGMKTCQNVAGFHEQLFFFPLYMFVSQACMLCSEQVSVNNLLEKTMASQFLTP